MIDLLSGWLWYIVNWLSTQAAISWLTVLSSIVTAGATFALWYATRQLVRSTNFMAEKTSQPHIVATLEPNQWSMNHFNLHVVNSGSGTAYKIEISFDPALPKADSRKALDTPLRKISVLRPGQAMFSYLCDYQLIKNQRFTVKVCWNNTSNTEIIEENSYTFDMGDFENLSGLGNSTPQVKIANELEKLRNDWNNVATGFKRLKTDVYSSKDRADERNADLAQIRKLKKERESK